MKLDTLEPPVCADVDAALRTTGEHADEHLQRARTTIERVEGLLSEFPHTAGTVQLEFADTYLRLARAELIRATGVEPEGWRRAGRRRTTTGAAMPPRGEPRRC